jgi:broad specificity phosphatase PhoE
VPDLTRGTRAPGGAVGARAGVGVVLWMRHGTSHDGLRRPGAHARPDTPLADIGHAQALAAAGRLRAAGPALVVSSPLRRARATAELLATALPAPLGLAADDLAEWRAPDCVLGLGPENYPPPYRHWRALRIRQPELALPGGESVAEFARRADRARRDVRRLVEDIGGPLVVVSHRVLIGAVAALDAGMIEPGAVFTAATACALAPAGVWRSG